MVLGPNILGLRDDIIREMRQLISTVSGLASVSADPSPTLGGDLDLDGHAIPGVTDAVARVDPGTTGSNRQRTRVRESAVEWYTNPVHDTGDYGAIADGTAHPLSERFGTLGEAQAVYPFVTALTEQIDWAASQAAVNAALAATPTGRVVAHGHLYWDQPVVIDDGATLVGFTFSGDGRGPTTIIQSADNEPHFEIDGTTVHSLGFRDFAATWSTSADAAKTARNVFTYVNSGGSLFNSSFERLTVTKGHRLLLSENGLVWGDAFREIMLSEMSGSFWRIQGATGEPNLTVDKLYINADTMIGPIFDGNALTVQMDNIEINGANQSPQIINDGGGAKYEIGLLGLETGIYDPAGSQNLFYIPNGSMNARRMYLEFTITTGEIYIFHCSGADSFITIDTLHLGVTHDGDGNCFVSGIGDISDPVATQMRFSIGQIVLYGGTAWDKDWPNAIALTDTGGTGSANGTEVRSWNDPTRIAFHGAVDTTAECDWVHTHIFNTSLASTKYFLLPEKELLFSGRSFTVIKSTTGGGGKVQIYQQGFALITEFADAEKGRATFVWNRSFDDGPSQGWTMIERMTWT